MIITCKLTQCPFNVKNFCAAGTANIDEMGMCSMIWKNGQQRKIPNFDNLYLKPLTLIELKKSENIEKNEKNEEKNEQTTEKINEEENSRIQENDKKIDQGSS